MSRVENASTMVAPSPRKFWNVPNTLTISRLALAVGVFVLIDYQVCDEKGFYQVIADAIGAEVVDLRNFEPPADILQLLPGSHAQLHRAFPLGFDDHVLQEIAQARLHRPLVSSVHFEIVRDSALLTDLAVRLRKNGAHGIAVLGARGFEFFE